MSNIFYINNLRNTIWIQSILTLLLTTRSYVHSVNLKDEFDVNMTKIFGPGLNPDQLVLPVQYFFIESYNSKSVRIEDSVGDKIKVQVEGETPDGLNCRVWVQVLDRRDGTYIARYRMYQTCLNVMIHVMYDYKHIAASPYKVEGPIYPETCDCPVKSITQWSELAKCPSSVAQIHRDLAPFQKVNMDQVLTTTIERLYQPEMRSFCNFIVKNNEIFRRCYGKHVGFSMFMEKILLSMARKMLLPDVEFIVNLGDWPISDKKVTPLLPIFAWCGSEETVDILMPTYDLTQATLEMMGGVILDVFSVQSNNDVPWDQKRPVGFWRGRDSRQERLDLIEIARQNPDLFNVSLTNFFFFTDQKEKYGPKAPYESFFKFFDNKYQINIDGTVAAYRFPYLLAGSGVVLKQESPFYEHFYRDLEPYVHYIPFKRDLSDLVEKIKWAIEHDSEAESISKQAREFVQENLLPKDLFCYHAMLLQVGQLYGKRKREKKRER